MTIQTSFSYDNYPNLWDEILSYASTEAKRDVRPVSRALRSAIDRRVRHLVLTGSPPPLIEKGLDVAEGVEACAYDWRSGALSTTYPVLQRISAWGDENDPWECWGDDFDVVTPAWSEQRALTRLTRVIDFRGYVHQWLHLGRIEHMFPSLHTLRLTQDANGTFLFYVPFAANTVVLFPNHKGLKANNVNPISKHFNGDDSEVDEPIDSGAIWPEPPARPELLESMFPEAEPAMEPPLGVPNGIPPGVNRIVVNLAGHIGNPGTSFHFLYEVPEHVGEVVFVLPYLSSLSDIGSVEAASAPDLVEVMHSSTARYTVVGAECVDDSDFAGKTREALKTLTIHEPHIDVDFSIDDELTRRMSAWRRKSAASRSRAMRQNATFLASVQNTPGPREPTMSLQQKLDDRLSRIEFVTVEEYRQRVGDETATLHLVQYPNAQ